LDGCTSIPVFNASASSTFRNLSTPFQVTYGSGKAIGSLGADTIEMAGFSITDQTFALVDQTIGGLLEAPVSGLLGLAWQTIASSGAVPFWQKLASIGAWDAPVMAFQLTRFLNASHPQELEPGGSFTMGFTNDSLYTGDIEYTSIPGSQGTYWILPMTELAVNGKSVSLLSGSAAYAAIDTGTTLVGGPSDQIEQVYAQIPGAQALTGTMSGYYTFPCATPVTVSVAFGGATTWDISPADFALPFQDPTGKRCLGAFFALDTGSAAPAWIVGDTFLKNVYSVFRYNPPSIGFARLAPAPLTALEAGPVPSPTIGVVATQISAASSNAASSRAPISLWTLLAAGAGALASAWVC
jgi:cathepsin D